MFRLRFLCEHDLGEVPCGPDARGYPIEHPKDCVKHCNPLMKVTLGVNLVFPRRALRICTDYIWALPRRTLVHASSVHLASLRSCVYYCRRRSFDGYHVLYCYHARHRTKCVVSLFTVKAFYLVARCVSAGIAVDLVGGGGHRIKRGPAPERSTRRCRASNKC